MFHSGDSVVIADGPFAGIEAIYQTADAEHRAFILLEILAKPVSMRIDTTLLRKTG
jgi:transcriptional antiterminator RfaH